MQCYLLVATDTVHYCSCSGTVAIGDRLSALNASRTLSTVLPERTEIMTNPLLVSMHREAGTFLGTIPGARQRSITSEARR